MNVSCWVLLLFTHLGKKNRVVLWSNLEQGSRFALYREYYINKKTLQYVGSLFGKIKTNILDSAMILLGRYAECFSNVYVFYHLTKFNKDKWILLSNIYLGHLGCTPGCFPKD